MALTTYPYARDVAQWTEDGACHDVEIQVHIHKEARTNLTRSNSQERREDLPGLWSRLFSFDVMSAWKSGDATREKGVLVIRMLCGQKVGFYHI